MTPSMFGSSYAVANIYYVYPMGELITTLHVGYQRGVRAVINIRSDVLIQEGDGTIENPFILTY